MCGVFVPIFDAGGKCLQLGAVFERFLPPRCGSHAACSPTHCSGESGHWWEVGVKIKWYRVFVWYGTWLNSMQGLLGLAYGIKTGFWPEISIGSEDSMSSFLRSVWRQFCSEWSWLRWSMIGEFRARSRVSQRVMTLGVFKDPENSLICYIHVGISFFVFTIILLPENVSRSFCNRYRYESPQCPIGVY